MRTRCIQIQDKSDLKPFSAFNCPMVSFFSYKKLSFSVIILSPSSVLFFLHCSKIADILLRRSWACYWSK